MGFNSGFKGLIIQLIFFSLFFHPDLKYRTFSFYFVNYPSYIFSLIIGSVDVCPQNVYKINLISISKCT